MRNVTKKVLALGLLGGSFLAFKPKQALWVAGTVVLFGFAVGDILEEIRKRS